MNLNNNIVFLAKGLVNVPKVELVDKATNTSKLAADLVNEYYGEQYKIAMGISVELMRHGLILSPSAFHGISLLSGGEQIKLAADIKAYLTELYTDGNYHTLFGDFPNTVLSMSSLQMLFHQIIHYWGAYLGEEYWPANAVGAEDPNVPFADLLKCCVKEKYDVIDAGSADDLADKIKTLVTAQQSLTSRDREIVEYFYKNIDNLALSPMKKLEMTSLEIPFKETLCIVSAVCHDVVAAKEINDVLRIAMFMSGADYTLAPIPKVIDEGWKKRPATKADRKAWNFKNFSNPEARQLMTTIETIVSNNKHALEDMKKYALRWIRLGEKLHPSSAKNMKKYPKTNEAFGMIRNCYKMIPTFGTHIEAAKKSNDLDKVLSLLKSRPGEFARQIDWLLRTYAEGKPSKKTLAKAEASKAYNDKIQSSLLMAQRLKQSGVVAEDTSNTASIAEQADLYQNMVKIMAAFGEVVDKISSKVLYELLDHFNYRAEDQKKRNVFIKGARKPVDLPLLDKLDKKTIENIQAVVLKEVIKRMAAKEDLSNKTFYLEDKLAWCHLPKNMRSTGEAIHQVARGTRMPLPVTSDLLRFYLFWEDERGTEDLDLHVYFYDESFTQVGYISWCGNYKAFNSNGEQYAQFSGDVRHHRGKCAEYVDVSISRAQAYNIRYVVAVARDFNGNGFKTSYAGVMARTKWGTPGETSWAPNTVENGFKITSCTQNVIIGYVDLKDKTLVNIDEDQSGRPTYSASGCNDIVSTLERYADDKSFFNGLSLLETYYNACGATVQVMSTEKLNEAEDLIKKSVAQLEGIIKDNPDYDNTQNLKMLEMYKSVSIIRADEYLKDYTKLLDFMA